MEAFRRFMEYGGRPGSGWVNQVTLVDPPTQITYSPVICAPFVKVPTLMIVSPEDELPDAIPAVARHVYQLIVGPKQWHEIAGGHFGLLYDPSDLFEESVSVQLNFLRRWVPLGCSMPE